MALIHYYKFNNNLYDSVGAFDLMTNVGTPSYTSGKLGGSTGAVRASISLFGCTGSGAAASGFMAADTTEAANGVSSWSMTGWLFLGGNNTSLIQLLTGTAGQSTANLYYDHKIGSLVFNASSAACSIGTWIFFTVRVTSGASYLSVNGGAESMTTWTTNMMAMGKSLFNGIQVGSLSGFSPLSAYIDDVRIFNHSLSSGEIAGIYNSGSPAEASSTALKWDQPIHHYKFTDNLNDSIGTDNATGTGVITYPIGLFANSPKSVLMNFSETIDCVGSSTWSSNSWTVSFWAELQWAGYSGYILSLQDASGYSFLRYYNDPKLNAWSLNGTAMFADAYGSGIVMRFLSYNHIAQRYTLSFAGNTSVAAQYSASGFSLIRFTAGAIFVASAHVALDDLRIYNSLLSGFDKDSIYNLGNGTEYSTTSASGSASGSLSTITMSGPAGSATGSGGGAGSASGALSTVTMSGPAGSASSGSPGSASGLLATITVSSFSGIGGVGVTGSGSLSTITVSSFTGIAFPEFIGTGSLGTVSVTAIEAVASISTSIQLSYCACDAEIGWKQSLPITGFVSAVQGEDAISARITPVVSGTDANIVFFEQRTLTASSSYTYDLRSLTDFLGQSFSLSRAYAISVVMTSGSATISPGASNPLQWFFNSTTANVTITSGNSFMFAQKGSAIVSNSAKTILVTNPSALSACVYKIAILGGR
jgi:hypothetical protein